MEKTDCQKKRKNLKTRNRFQITRPPETVFNLNPAGIQGAASHPVYVPESINQIYAEHNKEPQDRDTTMPTQKRSFPSGSKKFGI